MASAPSTNDLTRQQLDELDALLQKMLALPLNAPDGVQPTNSTLPRPSISDLPLPEMPIGRSTSPATHQPGIPKPSAWEPSPPTVWRSESSSDLAMVPQLLAAPSPIPPVTSVTKKAPSSNSRSIEQNSLSIPALNQGDVSSQLTTNPFQMKTAANSFPELPAEIAPNEPTPTVHDYVPPMLVPLVAINQVVNGTLGRLGLPGRFLLSTFGKNVLALAGLILLAFTAAKIAQVLGFVTLSTTLPWLT